MACHAVAHPHGDLAFTVMWKLLFSTLDMSLIPSRAVPVAGVIGATTAGTGELNWFRRLKNWYCSRKLWYSADVKAAASVALPSERSCVACPTILQGAIRARHTPQMQSRRGCVSTHAAQTASQRESAAQAPTQIYRSRDSVLDSDASVNELCSGTWPMGRMSAPIDVLNEAGGAT